MELVFDQQDIERLVLEKAHSLGIQANSVEIQANCNEIHCIAVSYDVKKDCDPEDEKKQEPEPQPFLPSRSQKIDYEPL